MSTMFQGRFCMKVIYVRRNQKTRTEIVKYLNKKTKKAERRTVEEFVNSSSFRYE
jgi:hypothetical protein